MARDEKRCFIVGSDGEADRAFARALKLDRTAIRRRFDQRFSSRAMADRYVALYRGLRPCCAAAGATKRLDSALVRID
jgi:hypothetical protein